MTIFYSDVEPLSKYSPVMLHLSPTTRILNENSVGTCRAVSMGQGQQFPPLVAMSVPPANFIGRTRKIEPKELPSYLSLLLLT